MTPNEPINEPKETARQELDRRLAEIKGSGRQHNAIEGLYIIIPRISKEDLMQ